MGIFFVAIASPYVILWIAVILLCVIIEAATVGLTSIWFAAGAVAALIFAALHFQFWLQVIVFVASSIALLLLTRPLLVDILQVGGRKSNVEELIGEIAVVIKDINEFEPGQVKVKGLIWTAITSDKALIPKGEKVTIERIEGVKLIVRSVE